MHSPVNIHGTPGTLAAQTGCGPMPVVFKGTGEGFNAGRQQHGSNCIPLKSINGFSFIVNGYWF